MNVLVIAGDRLGHYDPLTAHGVAAGRLLGEVTVLAVGPHSEEKARQAAHIVGVGTVLHAVHPALTQSSVENLALLLNRLIDRFPIIVAVSSTFGNDLIPRAAALSQRSPLMGVSAIDPQHGTFTRPIHAGTVLSTVERPPLPLFLTVRPTAFAAADRQESPAASIQRLNEGEESHLSQHVAYLPSPSQRPDPVSARIVVAGGGGLASGGSFALVEKLADRMGAAVGASRTAVDRGLADNDLQIGQTGRSVAPELYIGIGISGAIQHLAGIKDARMIVSINNDPGAPLHGAADYALTADLFEAIPKLIDS